MRTTNIIAFTVLAISLSACKSSKDSSENAEKTETEIVDAKDLVTWETACRYQMVHALALLLISQIGVGNKHIKWAGIYFMMGIFLFSGSLYLIALKDVFSMNLKFIGPLTPIGGLFFIVGWIKVFMFSISNKEKK